MAQPFDRQKAGSFRGGSGKSIYPKPQCPENEDQKSSRLMGMKLHKLPILLALTFCVSLGLTACGSIESAAQDDCASIGWQVGSKGYNDCFKARVYERKLEYSLPSGDQPRPSLL